MLQDNLCTNEYYYTPNTTIKKYTKTGIESVLGFMDQVKPFHTKVRTLYNVNTIDESSTVTIDETPKTVTTLAYGKPDNVIDYYDDKNYGPNTVPPRVRLVKQQLTHTVVLTLQTLTVMTQ